MCICVYVCLNIHTYIHACMHAMHAHTHTYIHTHTRTFSNNLENTGRNGTLYQAGDYLSMLGLKLNHVSKGGPGFNLSGLKISIHQFL